MTDRPETIECCGVTCRFDASNDEYMSDDSAPVKVSLEYLEPGEQWVCRARSLLTGNFRYLVRAHAVAMTRDVHKAARMTTTAFSQECNRVVSVLDHIREQAKL